MMKTVLVTGGAGYIGSHAAAALVSEGYRAVVLDDLSTGSREMVPKDTVFFLGNAGDERLVGQIVRDYGIRDVMHFAAFVDVAESQREPEKYYQNNLENTRRLLKAVRSAGVERFIFSSTAAVYGNPDQVPVSEHAQARPLSYYGGYKSMAEDAVARSGLKYAILRYFNVAGTHWRAGLGYKVSKDPTHLIRRVVLAMLGDIDHIEVFGTDYPTSDGTAVRDFIHVRDLVDVHIKMLAYLERSGVSDIYNVGYGKGYSVLEVIRAAEKILGKSLAVEYKPRRPGDIMAVVASTSKLAETINWQPQYKSIAGMIYDELDWVRSRKGQK